MANLTGWKAVRVDRRVGALNRGRIVPTLRFLYHSHEGSRVIPTGRWLEAKAKWVRNPGKRAGKAYRAGFQYLPTRADVARFNALTKERYSFIKVRVRQTWRKPTKGSRSRLARFLFVPHPFDAKWY